MTSRYKQIKGLVLKTRSLEGEQREKSLADLERAHPDLHKEVVSLLAHDGEMVAEGSVLEIRSELSGGRVLPSEAHPERIGNYRIRQLLGEGGMGLVYEAEQMEPIRRTVALKVIKRHHDSARTISRFEMERQTLTLMEHPGISRVLDAGTTEYGLPFFVMELVNGIPISNYCKLHDLSLHKCLKLFLETCAAIQHAHQKGIIHRDLKPSNILVTESRSGGLPTIKVIDFGIAKAMEGVSPEQTLFTTAGELVGTPEYMSPEQASGRPETIDSRSDIYSLGVILFELLTGKLPFPSQLLQEADLPEMLRIIREDEPPRPSLALTEERAGWKRKIRGDLEWITLRTLRKDPSERYASVSELASDIQRHLEDEPVEAGPPSRSYRFHKFVRRNRASLITLITLVLALVAGIVGTTWQAFRADRERLRAESRLVDLGALANRLVFGIHDRLRDLPGSTPVREYVLLEAAQILDQLSVDPDERGVVWEPIIGAYARLGTAQLDLGKHALGETSLLRSIELSQSALAGDPLDYRLRELLAETRNRLGRAYNTQGQIEKALASHESSVTSYRDLAQDHPDSLSVREGMSNALVAVGFNLVRMGQPKKALARYEEAISIGKDLVAKTGDEKSRTALATSYAYRGECFEDLGRDEEALTSYRTSSEVFAAGWNADPKNTLMLNRFAVTLGAVGGLLTSMARGEEAVTTLQRSLELRTLLCEINPQNVASRRDLSRGHLQLGEAYSQQGNSNLALESYGRAREIVAPMVSDTTDSSAVRYLADTLNAIAQIEVEKGQHEQCLRTLERVNELNQTLLLREPERQDHYYRQYTHDCLRARTWTTKAEHARSPELQKSAWKKARGWHETSRAVLLHLQAEDLGFPEDIEAIEDRTREIMHCDSVLATFRL